ncbi:hypothetical protein EG328_008312 [Venturia inaequalis]|uniref:non-specific serine/threonine protein kinase n=2 Tax=Venturia inaequalis TaxID=5025 RepID=A0A8H3UCS5_VENIN|nr:hypothetical protein EG328_008312 [Venturia inaequalis]
MASILRTTRRFLKPPSPPRQFPTTGFRILDNSLPVEEEREPFYSPGIFYPAKIGEVVRASDTSNIKREIDMYRLLNTVKAKHPGTTLVRKMLDNFEIQDNRGHMYPCIVHKPLGMSLEKFRSRVPNNKLPEHILKLVLIHILIALEFLHTKANIIHCDAFEKRELDNPTARKIDGDRIIYKSRNLDNSTSPGRPVLTDFGEARWRGSAHTGLIQPIQYRAPEVLFGMSWDYKVDVWNVGVMIWDLFEGNNMFKVRNAENEPSKEHHLAHIVALLGPPPADFVKGNDMALEYFNDDGSWKGTVKIPKTSLEESEHNLEGENKYLFLAFVRKMLKWRAEERGTARELLADTWLRDGDTFVGE